ncbi:50S ribosomal protein L29 [Streptomyces sp. 7-21]|jgi:large subunit ribosomal protein L29|uniref:50S ribosomal protein L29 n=1 Tax=Streptomyces sp. 7-21 TaxID=2802283 RepID=UPI001F02A19E|nr:50S ribosomal protein L29 [Streptomyces sp. 7-21]
MAVGTKVSELRELNDEELLVKLREAKEELFRLRFQAATGQLENNSRLKAVRKDIARVYTLMRERELGIETVAPVAGGDADKTAESAGQDEAVENA